MGISWQTIWQTSKVETHIKSMNRYILKFATVAVAVSAQKREFLKCAQIKKQMVTGEVAQEDREWAKENCLKLLGKGKGGKFRGALREAAARTSFSGRTRTVAASSVESCGTLFARNLEV